MARASITIKTSPDFIAPAHLRAFYAPGGVLSFARFMWNRQTPAEHQQMQVFEVNGIGLKGRCRAFEFISDVLGKVDRGYDTTPAQMDALVRILLVYQNTQMVDWYLSLPR